MSKNISSIEIGGVRVPLISTIQNGIGVDAIKGSAATAAGQMAFRIESVDTVGERYLLDSTEGLEVGMRVSIQLSKNYDDCGTIELIDGLTVKLTHFYYNSEEDITLSESAHLRALDYPQLGTFQFGTAAAAFGYETRALGIGSLSSGYTTEAHGKYSTSLGNNTKAGYAAFATGRDTSANGRMSVALGDATKATGQCAISGGYNSIASGDGSVAFGNGSTASGFYGIALGNTSDAVGAYSIAAGENATASGTRAYARGINVVASNTDTIATGQGSIASKEGAFVHGNNARATGLYSVAIGERVTASGHCSFAAPFSKHLVNDYIDPEASNDAILTAYRNCDPYEKFTLAKGGQSVALGRECVALGAGSVTIGYENISTNWGSATMGRGLISTTAETTTVGRFNDPTKNTDAVFVVGGGSDDTNRKNVFWVTSKGITSLDSAITECSDRLSSLTNQVQSVDDRTMYLDGCNEITMTVYLADGTQETYKIKAEQV